MAKGKMGFEGGKYSAKSGDLSKAQLKRAGATKAAAKQTVDIGKTRRATEGVNKGRTLGPAGKPLTGSVKLANGQMAVYKAGKRVINVKGSRGNGGGGNGSGGGNPSPPSPKTGSYQAGSGTTGSRNRTKTSQSISRASAIRKASAATNIRGEAKARAAARARNQLKNTDPYNSLINFVKHNSPVDLVNRLAALDTKGRR